MSDTEPVISRRDSEYEHNLPPWAHDLRNSYIAIKSEARNAEKILGRGVFGWGEIDDEVKREAAPIFEESRKLLVDYLPKEIEAIHFDRRFGIKTEDVDSISSGGYEELYYLPRTQEVYRILKFTSEDANGRRIRNPKYDPTDKESFVGFDNIRENLPVEVSLKKVSDDEGFQRLTINDMGKIVRNSIRFVINTNVKTVLEENTGQIFDLEVKRGVESDKKKTEIAALSRKRLGRLKDIIYQNLGIKHLDRPILVHRTPIGDGKFEYGHFYIPFGGSDGQGRLIQAPIEKVKSWFLGKIHEVPGKLLMNTEPRDANFSDWVEAAPITADELVELKVPTKIKAWVKGVA